MGAPLPVVWVLLDNGSKVDARNIKKANFENWLRLADAMRSCHVTKTTILQWDIKNQISPIAA